MPLGNHRKISWKIRGFVFHCRHSLEFIMNNTIYGTVRNSATITTTKVVEAGLGYAFSSSTDRLSAGL